MVAHQPPAADQVEDSAPAEKAEESNQEEDRPHFTDLPIVGDVVVGDVVRVTPAWQADRYDELEITSVRGGTTLMAGE
jgi:hypothetical protein